MPIRINRQPSRRDLRLFAGLWTPLFGAIAGGLSYWNGDATQATVIWGVAGGAALAGLASLRVARWLFVGLSYLTFPIGFVVSYVALALVYYVVVTPIALMLRARGRDLLRLRRTPETMWTPRPSRTGPERHFRQY
jgi:hypothetical protein